MVDPLVTIIVSPRERFSFARESLESLYENTAFPFKLVYVDNNSPIELRHYLVTQAQAKKFQLVQSEYYLSPNQSRNFGLRYVSTKYVVFVDNDVIFSPGWLKALVECTEATGATIVGSLVCQHRPVHTIVHCVGGEYMPPEELAKFAKGEPTVSQTPGQKCKWRVMEKIPHQNRPLSELRDQLKRQPTGFVEFHSMLVRTEVFEQVGPLDEKFSCTKEYLDFCMTVNQAGGTVYLEPTSIVTFLTHPPAPPLQWSDIPYYMLRWSDAWELASLNHFRDKWHLTEDDFFKNRYKRLGWRRQMTLINPIVHSILGRRSKQAEKILLSVDKLLNRYLTNRYARKYAQTEAKLDKSPAIASNLTVIDQTSSDRSALPDVKPSSHF